MEDIVLLPEFDIPQEVIRKAAAESFASGEELGIIIPIKGVLGLIDTEELAGQFLYAAYIGQTIAEACKAFRSEAPSSIHAEESVEFYLIPEDVEEFVARFWVSILGFMSEELLEQTDYDETWAAEAQAVGWEFLDKPELAPHTNNLVEHARALLAAVGYGEDTDN